MRSQRVRHDWVTSLSLLKLSTYSLDYTMYNKDTALSYGYTVTECDYSVSLIAKSVR